MTDGILLVDKPAGMTSFGVVARIRRILSEQQDAKTVAQSADLPRIRSDETEPLVVPHKRTRVKVGHTGTLDPFATGLMILVIGKECKNAQKYSKLDKTYEATIVIGKISTTGDPEGEITDVSTQEPTRQQVEAALKKFVGNLTQIPPSFSAIKINGQRAYKLARKGEKVVMPSRTVTIYSLELLDYTYPKLKIRTRVSSGTYIRTLAEDIGTTLGTGAYCSQLRRTAIAEWLVEKAQTFDL